MKKWAAYNPTNFTHLQFLMEAEMADIESNTSQCETLYEKAIKSANKNEWQADEAYANELAAKYFCRHNLERAASGYWQQAYYLLDVSGAAGKTAFLRKNYPDFFNFVSLRAAGVGKLQSDHLVGNSSGDFQNLDVATITRSSQAISEEIKLESLLGKIMNIIMMNAGAQNGILLLEQQGKLFIQASVIGNEVITMQNVPVKQCALRSRSTNTHPEKENEKRTPKDEKMGGL